MYKPSTTAGKGIKWEWLSVTTCDWNVYNMDVQNIIEDAWSKVTSIWTCSMTLQNHLNCEIICSISGILLTSDLCRAFKYMIS